MSSLRVICVAVLVGMGGVAGGLAGSGSSGDDGPTAAVRGATVGTAVAVNLDVKRENAKPGTPGWKIGAAAGRRPGLEAYAGAISVTSGTRVPLVVSGTGPVRIRAFRIGWYGGVGARQVWTGTLEARPQTGDPAGWSARGWADTAGWPPGDYLVRLDAGSGGTAVSRYVPLTVRSPSASGKVLLLAAPLTWEAQNAGTAASTSSGSTASGSSTTLSAKAHPVSFDRPYLHGFGAGGFLTGDLAVVQQAERTGRPLAYATDYDVAVRPSLVSGAAAVVTGNSQDWTASLRTALGKAQKAGANLAFFGGGIGSRSLTLNPHAASPYASRSTPRAMTVAATPAGGATARSTAATLRATGVRASCPGPATGPVASGSWVVANADWWGYEGTGARTGQDVAGLLGGATDRAATTATGSPSALQVLSYTSVTCDSAAADAATTSTAGTPTAGTFTTGAPAVAVQSAVYWVAPSGAGVFAAGTSRWPCAAAATCLTTSGGSAKTPAATRTFADDVIRAVVRAFAKPRAGEARPARSSAGRYSALR